MKTKLFILILLIAQIFYAQNITGLWTGNLDIQGIKLPLNLKISKSAEGYSSIAMSPKQGNREINVDKTEFINNELKLSIIGLDASYTGKFMTDHFEGIFIQRDTDFPLNLIKTNVFEITKSESQKVIPNLSNAPFNTQKIDDYLKYLVENRRGVGSVSIFRNGKEVYVKNFGQKQLTDFKSNTETEYHIGSISKMFTATMLFQQIEKGKLKLTDHLSKFYPDIPNAEKITIQQILNHSSGLGDYVGGPSKDNDVINKIIKSDDILKIIRSQQSRFEPGTKTQYSNSGYYLLSRILEKITNENYNVILNRNIIAKLNLKNTHSLADYTNNIFPSYKNENGKWEKIEELKFENAVGLGDITSTTTDLNIFINGLFSGKLLSNENLKVMMAENLKGNFGNGMVHISFSNQKSYGHGGDSLGTHSILYLNPENNFSVAAVVITDRTSRNEISNTVDSILFDVKDFKFPEFYKADEKKLSKYEGTYSSEDFPLKITITKNGDELKAQGTGQPSVPLTALEKDKFGFKPADFTIEFYPENNTATIIQYDEKYILTKE